MIPALRADEDLDEPVRTLALQIANSHLWRDASELAREAWEVLSQPDKDIETYRAALVKLQQANGLNPNNPSILMLLGPAQYKAGLYEEVLRTFERFVELTANKGTASSWGLAEGLYKAMALHQLGRVDEAKSTLEEVRALLKDDRLAKNEGLQTLLAEAEGLIEDTEQ